MICPHCQDEAEVFLVPDQGGEPRILARCYACCREQAPDGRWLLIGMHCRRCGAFLWRHARHGRYGHVVYLWPDPTHVTAQHAIFGAGPALQPYCRECAPAIGEGPPHQAECGGEPVTIGPVIGYLDAGTRYAWKYLPLYGQFLKAWLSDEVALEDEEISALMEQWTADVAGLRGEAGAGASP